ncbi:MAG: DUF4142 domain-containing protein [Bryobacteraceae bacterium]
MKIQSSLAVIFLVGTTASIYAQSSDQQFLKKAAQGNMAEVKLGQLAQQNGSNSSVKQFGERMVKDHSRLDGEAKEVAQKRNITLPTTVSEKDQSEYQRLSLKTGNDFDKAYITAMIRDHEKDIAEFQKEAKSGMDPEIKELAAKALPTLREHLQLARDAAKQLGISTNPTGGD